MKSFIFFEGLFSEDRFECMNFECLTLEMYSKYNFYAINQMVFYTLVLQLYLKNGPKEKKKMTPF